jgi:DDE superfamily endonuclease
VICLDELGPSAARRSPGPSWSSDVHRPHFRPEYARHGYRWAFGALAHRTGAVLVETAATRETVAWLRFLDSVAAFAPPGDASLIVDALPLHWSVDTMLWNWGHPRFHFVPLPKAAAWLTLLEGFWKILGQRALAGRSCASTEEIDHALHAGVADWNQHPTVFLWGRPPQPKRQLKRKYFYRI